MAGISALFVTGVASAGSAVAAGHPAAAAAPGTWTVYHGDAAGSGVGTLPAGMTINRPAWTSPVLDGHLYGEPLVSGGRVFVATENDTVYALSAATGKVIWAKHVATPVPSTLLPCGDIGPTVGITGTPVIDPVRGEIFAVADELVKGKPAHVLTGLSTATGRVLLTQHVDPPGVDTAALLQRTGLALDAGRVVFGFGGNDGDCAIYRGRVISVPEGGGPAAMFTVDAKPGQRQGAVWMGGGAPAVDRAGNVWVSAGNGSILNPARGYDNSDSALELGPLMRLKQFFAPRNWAAQNARDFDMSTEPALLPNGQVVVAGKAGTVYLLNGAHLGGIGGALAVLLACPVPIDGGMATVGTTIFLPCLNGISAVSAAGSRLRLLWKAGVGGGPPIVAGGLVWTISKTGTMYGLSPRTGAVRARAVIGAPANHFPTPSAAGGALLAAAANRVVAFRGRAAAAGGTAGDSNPAAATQPAAGQGGTPPGAIAAIAVAVLLVAGGTGWFAWRRRSGQPHGTAASPPGNTGSTGSG